MLYVALLYITFSPQIPKKNHFLFQKMNANVGDVDSMAPTACAACRHQRKRCDQYCQLARYFPPSKTRDYFNCHNLFGANNFLKILNSVEDHEREETAATLIYEAALWRKNPVQGSMARVRWLQEQIAEVENELDAVNEQVSLFKNLHSEVHQLERQLNKISLEIIPSAGLEENVEMNPPPSGVKEENDGDEMNPLSDVEENGGEMSPPSGMEEENGGGEMNPPSSVEEKYGGEMSPPSCVEEKNESEMNPPCDVKEEDGGEIISSPPPSDNN